eukprot:8102471-Pyramimonas_sp.AAC.2
MAGFTVRVGGAMPSTAFTSAAPRAGNTGPESGVAVVAPKAPPTTWGTTRDSSGNCRGIGGTSQTVSQQKGGGRIGTIGGRDGRIGTIGGKDGRIGTIGVKDGRIGTIGGRNGRIGTIDDGIIIY